MTEQGLDLSDIDFDSDPRAVNKARQRFEEKFGQQKDEATRLREENKDLKRGQALRDAGLDTLDADKQVALWAVHGDQPVTGEALKVTATTKLGFTATPPEAAQATQQQQQQTGPSPAQVAAAQAAAIGGAQGGSAALGGEFSTADMKGWSSQRTFAFLEAQSPEVKQAILMGEKVPASDVRQPA